MRPSLAFSWVNRFGASPKARGSQTSESTGTESLARACGVRDTSRRRQEREYLRAGKQRCWAEKAEYGLGARRGRPGWCLCGLEDAESREGAVGPSHQHLQVGSSPAEELAGPWGSRCEFHSPRDLGRHVSLAWIMRPLDPMETDSPQILQLGACQMGRVGTHGYILVMLALRPLCSLRKKELSSLSPWGDWRVSSHETPWERIVLSLR